MANKSKTEPMIWVNLDSLELWQRNYNQGAVAEIMTSIETFGFNQAVRVWNNVVMAGNHSTIALRNLKAKGWEPKGSSIQVSDSGDWQIQFVNVDHLTEEEAEAFAIADNHIASLAEPDDSKLSSLLQNVRERNRRIFDATGFTDERLEELLKSTAVPKSTIGNSMQREPTKGFIRPAIVLSDIAIFEQAIQKTGHLNRGEAVIAICKHYLESHGNDEKG